MTDVKPPKSHTPSEQHQQQVTTRTSTDVNQRPDVSRTWLTQYGLAYFGSCIGWAAPSQLLLGNQLMILRPEDKENALSLLMMIGGAAMVITSLFTGYLSDRTRSKIGRRMPWILAGTAICTACLALMPGSPNFALLVGLWAVFQIFMAFVTNNLLTLGPDVAPQRQFGMISGVLGATYTLGLVLGTVVASAVALAPAYYITAGLLMVLVCQMATGPGLRKLLEAERHADQYGDDATESVFNTAVSLEKERTAITGGSLHPVL
ncbi:MFS transporter [Corynebacterium anserum]|uniref:MFS transporter n=1 Tax=Corynebacterium anserum TaxID=2684406 RepID=UPI001FEA8E1F|nr:MFS transporter [Corynebacterium anserum]